MGAGDPSFDEELTIVRRRTWQLGALLAPLVAWGVWLAIGIHPQFDAVLFGIYAATILGLVRHNSKWLDPLASEKLRVTVTGGALRVDGRLASLGAAPRLFGYVVEGDRPRVRVFNRARRLVFEAEVSHVPEGERLLRALGLGSRPVVFVATPWLFASSWTFPVAALASLATFVIDANWSDVTVGFVAALVGVAALVSLLCTPRVVVGADGIELCTLARRRRFIPWTVIEAVAEAKRPFQPPIGRRLALTLASRTEVALHVRRGDADHLQTRFRRIVARRQRASIAEVTLDRAGQTTDAWIATLQGLSRGADTYRTKGIETPALVRVLTDPSEPETRRLAAAYVLRLRVPEESRAHIRVASDASANSGLRAALTELERDDLALGEAELRAFDAAEQRRHSQPQT